MERPRPVGGEALAALPPEERVPPRNLLVEELHVALRRAAERQTLRRAVVRLLPDPKRGGAAGGRGAVDHRLQPQAASDTQRAARRRPVRSARGRQAAHRARGIQAAVVEGHADVLLREGRPFATRRRGDDGSEGLRRGGGDVGEALTLLLALLVLLVVVLEVVVIVHLLVVLFLALLLLDPVLRHHSLRTHRRWLPVGCGRGRDGRWWRRRHGVAQVGIRLTDIDWRGEGLLSRLRRVARAHLLHLLYLLLLLCRHGRRSRRRLVGHRRGGRRVAALRCGACRHSRRCTFDRARGVAAAAAAARAASPAAAAAAPLRMRLGLFVLPFEADEASGRSAAMASRRSPRDAKRRHRCVHRRRRHRRRRRRPCSARGAVAAGCSRNAASTPRASGCAGARVRRRPRAPNRARWPPTPRPPPPWARRRAC